MLKIKNLFIVIIVCLTYYSGHSQTSSYIPGKSQLLLMYEANIAFIGEVVYVAPSPKSLDTGLTTSYQRIIFKVKEVIKGKVKDKYINVGFEVITNNGDLDKIIDSGDSFIVFLPNTVETDYCRYVEGIDDLEIPVNSKELLKRRCYETTTKALIKASEQEIKAVKYFIKRKK